MTHHNFSKMIRNELMIKSEVQTYFADDQIFLASEMINYR